jgi:hypothetical protein
MSEKTDGTLIFNASITASEPKIHPSCTVNGTTVFPGRCVNLHPFSAQWGRQICTGMVQVVIKTESGLHHHSYDHSDGYLWVPLQVSCNVIGKGRAGCGSSSISPRLGARSSMVFLRGLHEVSSRLIPCIADWAESRVCAADEFECRQKMLGERVWMSV